MFELLSRERKKVIRLEYSLHLVIACAWLLAVAALVWVIVLVPSVYVSYLRASTLETTAAAMAGRSPIQGANAEHSASIDAIRAVAAIASSSPAHPTFVLDAIDRLRGNVSISVISADNMPDTRAYSVTISGVAPNRTDVVSFGERLKNEKWVSTLDVPISSLVKEQEVPFTMSIKTIEVPYLELLP